MDEHEPSYTFFKDEMFVCEDELKTVATIVGTSEILLGGTLVGIGINGIDEHEAKTESEAYGSVTLNSVETFVTAADFGFGALALLGVGVIADGIRRIRRAR